MTPRNSTSTRVLLLGGGAYYPGTDSVEENVFFFLFFLLQQSGASGAGVTILSARSPESVQYLVPALSSSDSRLSLNKGAISGVGAVFGLLLASSAS